MPASESDEVGEAPRAVTPVRHRRQPRIAEVRASADTSTPDAELKRLEPVGAIKMVHANGVTAEV